MNYRAFLFLVIPSVFACSSPQVPETGQATVGAGAPTDPLPSWNEGPTKKALLDFVQRTTTEGSAEFVAVPDRIATFDNDGCLWAEQPMYFQLFFAIDRIKALAPEHPEWKTKEPFASVLKDDTGKALAGGERAILELVMASHTGMSTEEFTTIVKNWLATAKHPKTGKAFTDMTYQPMKELLAFLRDHSYKTFIVSGVASSSCAPGPKRCTAPRLNR
ncbi:MAG: haloacid dehalogenase-like hydrolase [Flavobacteriales bacterium]